MYCHNKVWCFLKYQLPLILSNLWGIFQHRGGDKTAGCSRNSWSNSWHLVFIVGNGSYIVRGDSKGETKWCSGCYVLIVGVSMVGFLVWFCDGAMYFFAIHIIEWHNMWPHALAKICWFEAPTLIWNFSVTATSAAWKKGNNENMVFLLKKKYEWIRIFVNFHMEVRLKFYFFWLCVYADLSCYLVADVSCLISTWTPVSIVDISWSLVFIICVSFDVCWEIVLLSPVNSFVFFFKFSDEYYCCQGVISVCPMFQGHLRKAWLMLRPIEP